MHHNAFILCHVTLLIINLGMCKSTVAMGSNGGQQAASRLLQGYIDQQAMPQDWARPASYLDMHSALCSRELCCCHDHYTPPAGLFERANDTNFRMQSAAQNLALKSMQPQPKTVHLYRADSMQPVADHNKRGVLGIMVTDEEVKALVAILLHPSITGITVAHMIGHKTLHTRGHRRVMLCDLYRHFQGIHRGIERLGMKRFVACCIKLLSKYEDQLNTAKSLAIYFLEQYAQLPLSSLLLVNPHLLVPNPHGRKGLIEAPDQVVLPFVGASLPSLGQGQADPTPIMPLAPTRQQLHTQPSISAAPGQVSTPVIGIQPRTTSRQPHLPPRLTPTNLPQLSRTALPSCNTSTTAQPSTCLAPQPSPLPTAVGHTYSVAPQPAEPVVTTQAASTVRSFMSLMGESVRGSQHMQQEAATTAHTVQLAHETHSAATQQYAATDTPTTQQHTLLGAQADEQAAVEAQAAQWAAAAVLAMEHAAAQALAKHTAPAEPSAPQQQAAPPDGQPHRSTMPVAAVLRLLDVIGAPMALKKTVLDFSTDERIATSMVVWLLNRIADTANKQAELQAEEQPQAGSGWSAAAVTSGPQWPIPAPRQHQMTCAAADGPMQAVDITAPVQAVHQLLPDPQPVTTSSVLPDPQPVTTSSVLPDPQPVTTSSVLPDPQLATTSSMLPAPQPATTSSVLPAPQLATTSSVLPALPTAGLQAGHAGRTHTYQMQLQPDTHPAPAPLPTPAPVKQEPDDLPACVGAVEQDVDEEQPAGDAQGDSVQVAAVPGVEAARQLDAREQDAAVAGMLHVQAVETHVDAQHFPSTQQVTPPRTYPPDNVVPPPPPHPYRPTPLHNPRTSSAFKPYTPPPATMPNISWVHPCLHMPVFPFPAPLAAPTQPAWWPQASGGGAAHTVTAAAPAVTHDQHPPALGLPIAIPCPMGIPFYGLPPIGLDVSTMQMTEPYPHTTPTTSTITTPTPTTPNTPTTATTTSGSGLSDVHDAHLATYPMGLPWCHMWGSALSAADPSTSWTPALYLPGVGLLPLLPQPTATPKMMCSPGCMQSGAAVEESQASDGTEVEVQLCKRQRMSAGW